METKHAGSCHCKAVRFEVVVDATRGSRCNCSICTKSGNLGANVKPAAFTLLEGEAALSTYAWGRQVGTRYFCKHCGINVFGRGHLDVLGGDYVSINFNALDDVDPATVAVIYFDGRHDNWMAGPRPAPWPIFTPAPAT